MSLFNEILSEEVRRGLILIQKHFDDDGHNWIAGTEMEDVEAAFEWIDRLRVVRGPAVVPSTRRHAVNQGGDCAHWCNACRENIERGLNPDGTAP